MAGSLGIGGETNAIVFQVLLVSRSEALKTELSDFLKRQGFKTIVSDRMDEARKTVARKRLALAVIDLDQPIKDVEAYIEDTKSRNGGFPVIITWEKISEEPIKRLLVYEKLIVLKRPFEIERFNRVLWSLMKDDVLLSGPKAPSKTSQKNRKYRRVNANLDAELIPFGGGKIKNLSGGGFMVNSGARIKPGSILYARVPEFGQFSVPVRVVWRRENSFDLGQTCNLGLIFVRPSRETSKTIANFIYEEVKGTEACPKP